jgi:hypothetical protein
MTVSIPRRRWLGLAAGALGAAAALTALSTCAGYNLWTNEYTFSQKQLQSALARKFPFSKRYMVFDVNLTNPKLMLDAAANRVTVQVDARIDNPLFQPQTVNGVLALNSGLKYDAPSRSLRLDQPTVERFELSGVPAQYGKQMNMVGSLSPNSC